MTDLERLDEALERWKGWETADPFGLGVLYTAARAYRNLLANGERVHDKNRTCERTEEVLENYRKRAIRAEQALANGPYRKLDPAWDGSQPYGGV